LKLLPAKNNTGYFNLTQASWGGAPIKGNDGRFHLYAAQMLNSCPLSTWVTNSVIIRADSDNIMGPYTYKEQVLQAWGHNPMPARAPDGTYLIYHIGDGKPMGEIQNCTHGEMEKDDHKRVRFSKKRTTLPEAGEEINVNILFSETPVGPWRQHKEVQEDPADNPTPYFFPNGTVILLHRIDIWANDTPISYILEATAKHWTGPYISRGGPIFLHQNEDPFIYRNNAGHFHALFHGMEEGYTDQKSYAGRHAFSRDGLRWTFSDIPAYNSSVLMENGSITTFKRRERPQVTFEKGIPKYLWSGIKLHGVHSWTFVQEITFGDGSMNKTPHTIYSLIYAIITHIQHISYNRSSSLSLCVSLF